MELAFFKPKKHIDSNDVTASAPHNAPRNCAKLAVKVRTHVHHHQACSQRIKWVHQGHPSPSRSPGETYMRGEIRTCMHATFKLRKTHFCDIILTTACYHSNCDQRNCDQRNYDQNIAVQYETNYQTHMQNNLSIDR